MENALQNWDIYLAKARFADWQAVWRNVWCHAQTARHMLWQPTVDEPAARERMHRTLAWQAEHDAWLVYEKAGGQPIGFAGVVQTAPGIWEDTGIALGPAYTGRGYGRQILDCLAAYCAQRGGRQLVCTTRSENAAAKALLRAAGFTFTHAEPRTDPRTQQGYTVEYYGKEIGGA